MPIVSDLGSNIIPKVQPDKDNHAFIAIEGAKNNLSKVVRKSNQAGV